MSLQEAWLPLPIPALAPNYEISDLGRVRRSTPGRSTFAGRVLKLTIDKDGYHRINIQEPGGRGINVRVPRLVATAFLGAPPSPTHEVAHWDGDRANSQWMNLRWATPLENKDDARRHGTVGGKPGRTCTPLTADEIAAIRASSASSRALAKQYGVNRTTVSRCRRYLTN